MIAAVLTLRQFSLTDDIVIKEIIVINRIDTTFIMLVDTNDWSTSVIGMDQQVKFHESGNKTELLSDNIFRLEMSYHQQLRAQF